MVSKVRLVTAEAASSVAGATRYTGVAGNINMRLDSNGEDIRGTIFPIGGTLSELFVRILSNAASADSTVTVRVGGASASQSVTIGAGMTGTFEDMSNTDSVDDDDVVSYDVTTGAGGVLGFGVIAQSFTGRVVSGFPNVDTMRVGNGYDLFIASNGFQHVYGSLSASSNESTKQCRANIKAEIWDHFACHISSNPKTSDLILRNRKNGSNGSLEITVGAGMTGHFEDVTGSDSCEKSDLINYSSTSADTGNTVVINYYVCHFHANRTVSTSIPFGCTHDVGTSFAAGATYNVPLGGRITAQSNVRCPFGVVGTAENLGSMVFSNSLDGDCVITFMKNGSATSLTFTISATSTGQFNDLVNTDEIEDTTDDGYFQIDTTAASSGSITINNVRMGVDLPIEESGAQSGTVGVLII